MCLVWVFVIVISRQFSLKKMLLVIDITEYKNPMQCILPMNKIIHKKKEEKKAYRPVNSGDPQSINRERTSGNGPTVMLTSCTVYTPTAGNVR